MPAEQPLLAIRTSIPSPESRAWRGFPSLVPPPHPADEQAVEIHHEPPVASAPASRGDLHEQAVAPALRPSKKSTGGGEL